MHIYYTCTGSLLYNAGGYTLVFAVKALFNFTALAYVLLRLWNFEENVIRMKNIRKANGEIIVNIDLMVNSYAFK